MTALDQRIRSLVHDRVAEAPTPLSAIEIVARATIVNVVPLPSRRRPWVVVAVTTAGAALILAAVLVAWSSDRSTRPSTPRIPAEQLVLPQVPDGWMVLEVSEGVSQWGDGASQVAVYTRDDPATTVRLNYIAEDESGLSYDSEFEVPAGHGSWGTGCGGVCFDLNLNGGGRIDGDVSDTREGSQTAVVRRLAAYLSVNDEGMPILDPESGFTLSRMGRATDAPSVMLMLRYGRSDADGVLWFTIESGGSLLDASLVGGADVASTRVGDQTYWVGGSGTSVNWSSGGARYRVFGFPDLDPLAVATSAAAATVADLDRLAAEIGAGAELTESTEVHIAGRSLGFEQRQFGEWTFVCLRDSDQVVCRNILAGSTSVLLAGHWYVIQNGEYSVAHPHVGTIVAGRNEWRLTAIADSVDGVQLGEPGESPYLTRPRW